MHTWPEVKNDKLKGDNNECSFSSLFFTCTYIIIIHM